jgi:hypothetical protein
MSKEQLFRISGLVAIAVGMVMVVFNSAVAFVEFPQQLINYRTFLTPILLVFAFTGLYVYQAQRAGILGLAGYVLTVISLVLNVCFRFSETFIGPILLAQFPDSIMAIVQGPYSTVQSVTVALFLAGYVLFGIATLRARMLPRWGAWLLIVGAVISFALMMLPINMGAILAGAGFVWMGYDLYSVAAKTTTTMVGQAIPQQ